MFSSVTSCTASSYGSVRAAVAVPVRGQGVSTSRTPASPVACRARRRRPRPAAPPRARRPAGRPRRARATAVERGPPLLGRQRVVRVAEDGGGAAAQHGGGELARRRRTRRPRLTSRPPVGQHPGGRGRRDAEDRVDDDVGAAADGVLRAAAVSASTSPVSGTTASAPGPPRPLLRPPPTGRRATTRPAPSSFAAPTAAWPTAPPAPSTSTRSPGCSRARSVSAIQAATPDMPERRRRVVRRRRPVSGTTSSSGTAHRSARLPSPGRHAGRASRTKTRVPGGQHVDRSTTPTPWTPGTYGHRRAARSRRCRRRTSRSSGTIGAAVTRTTCARRRPGSGCSPYAGGLPRLGAGRRRARRPPQSAAGRRRPRCGRRPGRRPCRSAGGAPRRAGRAARPPGPAARTRAAARPAGRGRPAPRRRRPAPLSGSRRPSTCSCTRPIASNSRRCGPRSPSSSAMPISTGVRGSPYLVHRVAEAGHEPPRRPGGA